MCRLPNQFRRPSARAPCGGFATFSPSLFPSLYILSSLLCIFISRAPHVAFFPRDATVLVPHPNLHFLRPPRAAGRCFFRIFLRGPRPDGRAVSHFVFPPRRGSRRPLSSLSLSHLSLPHAR